MVDTIEEITQAESTGDVTTYLTKQNWTELK